MLARYMRRAVWKTILGGRLNRCFSTTFKYNSIGGDFEHPELLGGYGHGDECDIEEALELHSRETALDQPRVLACWIFDPCAEINAKEMVTRPMQDREGLRKNFERC